MAQQDSTFPPLYRALLISTAVESVIVFARPVVTRLMHPEGWPLYTSGAVLKSWLVDLHAAVALGWIALFVLQFRLGHQSLGPAAARAALLHRLAGRAISFGLVPVMALLSVWVLLVNPLGFPPFIAANIGLMWVFSTACFVAGVLAIRARRLPQHVDALYVAFITMSAVSTYRLMLVGLFVLTGHFFTSLPALLTWGLVLAKIILPFRRAGRLDASHRGNRALVAALSICAALFAAWGVARGLLTDMPAPVPR